MVTEKGVIKKTNLDAFSNPRKNGIIAIKLDKGDQLLEVAMSDGDSEVVIATYRKAKRSGFTRKTFVRWGRNSRGVKKPPH